MTACGASVWPDWLSQLAPLSPSVFGVWLNEPVLVTHIALTSTSSTSHMAGFAIPPSEADLTTRNCCGGETPSLPSLPGAPCGPCGPGEPAAPTGPGSPLSPLSPLSPFGPAHAATAKANERQQARCKVLRI